MQINEFIEATAKLETYYGKDYTTEQRQIMFEELKGLEITRYRQLVSAILRKSKYLPKLADFIETNIEEPYTRRQDDSNRVNCDICNGEGYVYYKKIIGNSKLEYDFACRCICKNGLNQNRQIPTFQELGIRPNSRVIVKE